MVILVNPRTGAERYLAQRLDDPEYRAAYNAARDRIAQIDTVVNSLDSRRIELGMSKAELARRAGVKPEAIRRLFSVERPNPTLSTLVALADRARPERRDCTTITFRLHRKTERLARNSSAARLIRR